MKLKTLFVLLYSIIIASLLVLAVLSFSIIKHQTHLLKSQDNRFRSYVLANEIKESSSNLTRFCRTYAMTGDSTWEQKYWDILDIRNGKKSRPDGRTISIQDSIMKLGLTKSELIKLQEAEYNSNQLVYTEQKAFYSLKGLYNDGKGNFTIKGQPDTAVAQHILFDEQYHRENARINEPIDEFFRMLNRRTQDTVRESNKTSRQMLIENMSLIIVIVLIAIITFFILRRKIYNKLSELEEAQLRIQHNEKLLREQNNILDEKVTIRTAELKAKNEIYAALNNQYKLLNIELEEATRRAEESDVLKTKFLNSISHEVRTPMNGIIGFTNLLDDPDMDADTRKSYIKIILENGEQLVQIIDNILELSQLTANQETVVEKQIDLAELFHRLSNQYYDESRAQNTPITIERKLSKNQGIIISDEKILRRILSNLISNAIKFTPSGYINIGYYLKNKAEITLYVQDTGIGISEENAPNIFNNFMREDGDYSIQKGGLGIGLAIAKKNITLLEGEIGFTSTKNKGSNFYITLPYKPVDNTKIESNNTFKPTRRKTIVIIEEEEINHNYINLLLKKALKVDYDTIHVPQESKAIEVCQANKNIDLVLIDLKSTSINTHRIITELHKALPQLPIIAQSTFFTTNEQVAAHNSGCSDLIPKPISLETLKTILSKYLGYQEIYNKKKDKPLTV